MLKIQQDVIDFMKAINQDVHDTPEFRDGKPDRVALMREEFEELIEAIEKKDMIGFIKEACDVLVTVLGTCNRYGVDLEPFWNEVCKSNMTKVNCPNDPVTGKKLKDHNYVPADIEGILKSYREQQEVKNSPLNIVGKVGEIHKAAIRVYKIKGIEPLLSSEAGSVLNKAIHGTAYIPDEDAAPTGKNGNNSPKLCQYFCKVVPLSTTKIGDSEYLYVDSVYVKKLALVMNYLASFGYIRYGALTGPGMVMELVGGRAAILTYVFSDYTNEQLNKFLDNEAFMVEGSMGNEVWPEICDE